MTEKEQQESDKNFDDFIKYVNDQIQKINEYASLIRDGYVIPEKINWLLAEYEGINNTLIADYEILLRERSILEKEYQKFWDSAFLKSRDKLNSSRVASKYASLSEIESQTRVDYAEEYSMWKDRLNELDAKINFIKRLRTSWEKEDNLITTLSYNIRSEMKALKVEDRANGAVNGKKEMPTKEKRKVQK